MIVTEVAAIAGAVTMRTKIGIATRTIEETGTGTGIGTGTETGTAIGTGSGKFSFHEIP
jgi:hypothetical protein